MPDIERIRKEILAEKNKRLEIMEKFIKAEESKESSKHLENLRIYRESLLESRREIESMTDNELLSYLANNMLEKL